MSIMHIAEFGAVLAALLAAHPVGDYWVQTSWQAAHKGDRLHVRPWLDTGRLVGWGKWARINGRGWAACLSHVATYTATAAAAIGLLIWQLDLPVAGGSLLAGLAVTAASHALVDRRRPLEILAGWVRKDHDFLYQRGGLAQLDQAWHLAFALVTALVVVS